MGSRLCRQLPFHRIIQIGKRGVPVAKHFYTLVQRISRFGLEDVIICCAFVLETYKVTPTVGKVASAPYPERKYQPLRSLHCCLLYNIFQDFGIHPRIVIKTSLTASSLPRRSGRSPLQSAAAFHVEMSL